MLLPLVVLRSEMTRHFARLWESTPHDTKKALVPAPTGISPAPAAKQKQNKKNDQYGSHVSTSLVRGSSLTRLASSAGPIIKEMKMDYCPHRDTCAFCLRCPCSESLATTTLRPAKVACYSCRTTLRRELSMWISLLLYWMKPSFLNLFMKKLTRDRVVPIISASISCDTLGSTF